MTSNTQEAIEKILVSIKDGLDTMCEYYYVFDGFEEDDHKPELKSLPSMDFESVFEMVENKQYQYYEGIAQLLEYVQACDVQLNEDVIDDDMPIASLFPDGNPTIAYLVGLIRSIRAMHPEIENAIDEDMDEE